LGGRARGGRGWPMRAPVRPRALLPSPPTRPRQPRGTSTWSRPRQTGCRPCEEERGGERVSMSYESGEWVGEVGAPACFALYVARASLSLSLSLSDLVAPDADDRTRVGLARLSKDAAYKVRVGGCERVERGDSRASPQRAPGVLLTSHWWTPKKRAAPGAPSFSLAHTHTHITYQGS